MSDNETRAYTDGTRRCQCLDDKYCKQSRIQRTRTLLDVCLLSYNQVQIPLTEPCLQQNFSLIKRFRDCTTFLYPLPQENVLRPNSFTRASYTHRRYNCSGNEHAKAANWDGNKISSPAMLVAPFNLTSITQYI